MISTFTLAIEAPLVYQNGLTKILKCNMRKLLLLYLNVYSVHYLKIYIKVVCLLQ